MDAVTAIMNDHRVMERLFAALRVVDGDPREVLAEIKARLLAHSVAEEEHVYPALVKEDPGEAEQVHHGVDEHREAEEKLAAAEAAIGTPAFADACKEFIHAVTHHVEEEETEILPALREETPAAKLDELGAAFEERRLSELAGTPYFDQNVTKDDLYNQARKAGVAGRSDMNKDELRQAVERQNR
ncbi:hemerythrin domain-containing protein [Phytomonospora sp. NPDC050363]|uniref:hemerythrin domain-containing protein n=1 Tax=Phytomonospora sp. NPDC050363 TaxID=3155642 RepID=UPI003407B0F9